MEGVELAIFRSTKTVKEQLFSAFGNTIFEVLKACVLIKKRKSRRSTENCNYKVEG